MDENFQSYVERLHPSFERLIDMRPISIRNLPKPLPQKCIYLFSEDSNPLYVGRTNNFRKRLGQHSNDGSQHNQAVFAFKLARESTGRTVVSYKAEGSRSSLIYDPVFAKAFLEAKRRVKAMDLRFVEEQDQLRQALLEIYVAVVLQTPYNDFSTH